MKILKNLIKKISPLRWIKGKIRAKRHKKTVISVMEKMNPESPNFDPKYFKETKRKFNQTFGANTQKRTPLQWRNLLRTYGIEVVCQKEAMTPEEVMKRCRESRDERNKRLIRENNKLQKA